MVCYEDLHSSWFRVCSKFSFALQWCWPAQFVTKSPIRTPRRKIGVWHILFVVHHHTLFKESSQYKPWKMHFVFTQLQWYVIYTKTSSLTLFKKSARFYENSVRKRSWHCIEHVKRTKLFASSYKLITKAFLFHELFTTASFYLTWQSLQQWQS